jgi:ABC-type sugar transport system ATPase subunit
VSHRLSEILRLADRITVLRDGHSIGTRPAAAVSQRELVRWMVGRDVADHGPPMSLIPGDVALEVRDLRSARVDGVSFELRYGEVLGLAGLVGAGRTELARALFGIDPIDGGEIRVDGRPVVLRHPPDALAAVLLHRTRFGQHLYAMGGNREAAPSSSASWTRASTRPASISRSSTSSKAL